MQNKIVDLEEKEKRKCIICLKGFDFNEESVSISDLVYHLQCLQNMTDSERCIKWIGGYEN